MALATFDGEFSFSQDTGNLTPLKPAFMFPAVRVVLLGWVLVNHSAARGETTPGDTCRESRAQPPQSQTLDKPPEISVEYPWEFLPESPAPPKHASCVDPQSSGESPTAQNPTKIIHGGNCDRILPIIAYPKGGWHIG